MYDKLLKPRQLFRINLCFSFAKFLSFPPILFYSENERNLWKWTLFCRHARGALRAPRGLSRTEKSSYSVDRWSVTWGQKFWRLCQVPCRCVRSKGQYWESHRLCCSGDGASWWIVIIKPTRCTYLLTPRCRVLLEQLTGLQVVKKFHAFHETYLLTYSLTYLLTYLLTHSTVQSPSWAADWFAASQEIPRISRNLLTYLLT